MSYTLAGTDFKRPTSIGWSIVSQFAENKTLDGSVSRDYFGSDKNVWQLSYKNVTNTDYLSILALYQDYLTNGVRYFQTVGESIVVGALVHVSLSERQFTVGGSDYLADFTLTLTEA
jgi:hypothetical protein